MCNIDVTASANPMILCQPGQVSLNASITGLANEILWTPSNLVSIPTASSTTAFVQNTTTFTVTVSSLSDNNLITNGDFNAGITGFTSDYFPGSGGTFGLLSNEGEYAVSTNPALTHTNFANCGDHTGGGSMLVVNGAGVANQNVICQIVNVTPFTNYGFSAWVMSVVSSAPALLQFSVNGVLLGNIFNAPSATCVWSQFFQEWNSGPNSSVEICMVNQNTAASGNDFAVDDLFFAEICEASDEVTVIVQPTDATWTPPTGLCPLSPPFDLNTLLGPTATPGGFWTVNNLPTVFFDPLLLGDGVYQVTYTVGTPPCVAMETHFIIIDPLPSPDWDVPQGLCTGTPPFLLNNLLSPNATTGGVWTINGQISTFLSPSDLGEGTYTLAYSVGTNPCIATLEQDIQISAPPLVDWNPPPPLCLGDPAFPLNNLLEPGIDPGGFWTINGNNSSTFNPAILGAGQYNVTYQLGDFPCDASLSFIIEVNAGLPAPELSCEGISSNSVTIAWSDVPGADSYVVDIISNQDGTVSGNSVTIDNLPGNTIVTVVVYAEDNSGCFGIPDTISCQAISCIPPDVAINPVDTICFDSSLQTITLEAVVNPTGGSGQWAGPGITDASNGTFDPVEAGSGLHLITYTYTANACSTTDSLEIFLSPPPEAAFSIPTLICSRDTIEVAFTGTAGANAEYIWDFNGGIIIDGEGAGPFQVHWGDTSGMVDISLIIIENGCTPDTATQTIQVDVPIEPPTVICDPTLSTISFTWNDVENTVAYIISVINGPLGTITSDTSYLIENLNPEQEVGIRMLLVSSNACPDSLIFPLCETIACPGGPVIDNLPPLCVSNVGDTLQLSYSFPDSIEVVGNTIIWSGPGVVDSTAGLLEINNSMLNQDNEVYLWFYNGFCSYRDTLTFNILPELSADFNLPEVSCIGDTVEVSFAGGTSPTTTYNWDFGSAVAISGSGPGPYQLVWDTTGIQTVSLQITAGDCSAPLSTEEINIESPIDTPQITCTRDFTSILFEWNTVDGAAGFQVNVLTGPPGQLINSNAYLVDNLIPGQEVEIELIVESSNSCADSRAVLSCSTFSCPEIDIQLEAVDPICFNGTDNLQLNWTISGDTTGGRLFFTGENLLDTLNGIFLIDSSRIGQSTTLFLNFEAGVCLFSDSIVIDVLPTPVADFSLTEQICVGTTDTLVFTGIASPTATYLWDFAGQTVIPGTGPGPHTITWSTPGFYPISLSVIENNCASEEIVRNVNVTAPLPDPIISCESDYTNISIHWTALSQAAAYTLAVPTGLDTMWLSDTSVLINNLLPGTSLDFSLTVLDSTACPDQVYDFSCETLSCPQISMQWLAQSPICVGDTSIMTFSFTGADSGPYDVTINDGTSDTFYAGLTDGSTIPLLLTEATTLNVVDIQNIAIPACALVAPAPLTIVVNEPVDAGTAMPTLEICNGVDTVINLIDRVQGAEPGGIWVETSVPPSTGGAFDPTNGTLSAGQLTPGDYQFEYQLTGAIPCPNASVSIDILIHPTPVLTWDAESPICQGETSEISLHFSEPASGPFDVLISMGQMDSLFTGLNDGSTLLLSPTASTDLSIVSITNSPLTGCSVVQPGPINIVVNQPVNAGNALAPLELCSGLDTLLLLESLLENNSPGGVWQETSAVPSPGGAFNASNGSFNPQSAPAGIYSFEYAITAAQPCPNASAEVMVIIHPTPVSDAGLDLSLDCQFNTGSIGGSATSTGDHLIYEWTIEGNGNILDHTRAITDVNLPGIYTLTVIDTLNGCSQSDEVVVNYEIAFLLPEISISNISCFQANDGTINITEVNGGTPPYIFYLNETSVGNQSFFSPLSPGTYDIRIVDSDGCEVEVNFNLDEPDEVDVRLVTNIEGAENVIQLGDEILLNALFNIPIGRVDTILWQPDSLNAKSPEEMVVSPQQTTTFGVTVIDTSGCSDSDQLTIYVRKDRNVYIPNSFSPNNDGTNDVAMIFAGQEVTKVNKFMIFNRWGETMFEAINFQPNNPAYGWNGLFRGKPLNPAVFVFYAEIETIDGEIVLFKGDIALIK
ncbi:MAG: hypothetical protein DHS20C18_08630 [Saprospiraceae bacterium]|nr:MAG: hypothetical protein DHS20C18_08630 [Saprospiraceae bacterium]